MRKKIESILIVCLNRLGKRIERKEEISLNWLEEKKRIKERRQVKSFVRGKMKWCFVFVLDE